MVYREQTLLKRVKYVSIQIWDTMAPNFGVSAYYIIRRVLCPFHLNIPLHRYLLFIHQRSSKFALLFKCHTLSKKCGLLQ